MTPEWIEVGRPGTLSVRFYDADGVLADADGDVTVTVVDGAGAEVVAEITADKTGGVDGTYTVPVPAQSEVAALVATWVGEFSTVESTAITYGEVVGWFLFSIAAARAWDKAAMTSTSNYPPATIRDERVGITGSIEDKIGWSPVPRWTEATLSGSGSSRIDLPDHRVVSILAATVGGVALTSGEIADLSIAGSTVVWDGGTWAAGTLNVIVRYRRGRAHRVADADRVGLYLLRDRLLPADISPRTLSMSDDVGNLRMAMPGERWPFGIPIVDQWVASHDERLRVG